MNDNRKDFRVMKRIILLVLTVILALPVCSALAEEWTCPNCGKVNQENFCPDCGTKKPESWLCPGCGRENISAFCPNCGTRVPIDGQFSSSFGNENVLRAFLKAFFSDPFSKTSVQCRIPRLLFYFRGYLARTEGSLMLFSSKVARTRK